MDVDYEALAQQYGGTSSTMSTPPGVVYTDPDPPPSNPPPPAATPSPTATAAGPTDIAGAPFTYDELNALYHQYLGPTRSASQQEYANWANGTYGPPNLASMRSQIASSGEAQAYAKKTGGAAAPAGATGDPGAYLLRLLQGGMDRDQAIAQTGQAFGLQPGQDGYPLYYPGNNTIGLHGSYLANVGGVWNQQMRGNEGGGGGQTGSLGSVGNTPVGSNGYPIQPLITSDQNFFSNWDIPFVAPTEVSEQNDPGFKARMQQGQQALERSAASKGTLLTGGTLKDITQFGQDYASNEYANVYGRALGEYQQAYNIFNQQQGNTFNRLASLANLGQTAVGSLSTAGTNYSNSASGALYGIGNANAAGAIGQGNIFGNLVGGLTNAASAAAQQRGTGYRTPGGGV